MTEPDSEPREKPDPKTEERERRQANMILLAGWWSGSAFGSSMPC
jgi:hypothetical protein